MLYCGIYNTKVQNALKYLPDDIYDKINGKIAITFLNGDACRLAQKICNHDEIIILSPWIFSYIPAGSCEIDNEYKYFIFCILHEIAHVVCKHSPPDELSGKKIKDQEDEADEYAIKWFNSFVLERSKKGLIRITIKEIRETKEKYQKKIEENLSCS